jgi:hypothetical protein
MSELELRWKQAVAALEALFSVRSVSAETVLDKLQELRDELEMKIYALESDIERSSKSEN